MFNTIVSFACICYVYVCIWRIKYYYYYYYPNVFVKKLSSRRADGRLWTRRMQNYVGRLLFTLLAFGYIQPTHSVACGRFPSGRRIPVDMRVTQQRRHGHISVREDIITRDRIGHRVTRTQISAHNNYAAFIDFNCYYYLCVIIKASDDQNIGGIRLPDGASYRAPEA